MEKKLEFSKEQKQEILGFCRGQDVKVACVLAVELVEGEIVLRKLSAIIKEIWPEEKEK